MNYVRAFVRFLFGGCRHRNQGRRIYTDPFPHRICWDCSAKVATKFQPEPDFLAARADDLAQQRELIALGSLGRRSTRRVSVRKRR